MKNKFRLLSYILLIITFSLSFDIQIFGQEKVIITAGLGFPELLNIGVRYQLGQAQIGLSVGGVPFSKALSISSDVFYHFDRLSKFSTMNPWYCRVGLDYWNLNEFHASGKFLFFNFRLGRDINISPKIGIEIDAGGFFHSDKFLNSSPIAPGLGIRVFYKI